MIAKTKPAVGYIRMSTDKQEDSPARQRRDIERMADRQNYRITGWYEDHGLTGTESLNRPEFQRLLKNAKTGKFEAILLSEQSRMSREDVFDAMMHWKVLRDAGVRIVTCQRGELDFSNLGGVITAIVDQYGAREESVKLAQRVVSGQRLKVMNGQRIGGFVFGYDREIVDEKGKCVRRVHCRERFKRPANWSSKLVISEDRKAVSAIRWAFNAFVEGESLPEIAREFNRRGLATAYGNAFTISSIKGVLVNPTYAGILRVGKWARSKFCSITDNNGIIEIEGAHPAIVERELFDSVQDKLSNRGKTRSPFRKYLLSGMATCHHCGRNLHGVRRINRQRTDKDSFYECDKSRKTGCPHPAVRVEKLEQFVIDKIQSTLLTTKMESRVREAIIKAKRQAARGTSRDHRKLKDLRRKIERGTENLALAEKGEFKAISALLARWQADEAELAMRLEKPCDNLEPLPDALRILKRLPEIQRNITKAEFRLLADAISKTVATLSIGVRDAHAGDLQYREYFGELAFHDAFETSPIVIPDEVLGQRRIWRELGELVRASDRPLHLKDFGEHIGTTDASHAAYHVRRAEQAGLIKKIGHYGGWESIKRTR